MEIRDFLYMDTDYLDSYLSQIEDGLMQTSSDTVTDEVANSQTDHPASIKETNAIEGGAEIGAPAIAKLFGKAKQQTEEEYEKSIFEFSQTEIGQSIITKRVYDDAFNRLYDHISKNSDYNIKTPTEIGRFICKAIPFQALDFGYFKKIFTDENVKKIMPDIDKNDEAEKRLSDFDEAYKALN